MNRVLVLAVATATSGFLAGAALVQATPITYTEAAIASGSLGGSPFSDALVTVTLTGDTSGVGPGAGPFAVWLGNVGPAEVTVAGLGTATLTGTIEVFSGLGPMSTPWVIIAQWDNPFGTSITGILGLADSRLSGYDLRSPLGPITGSPAFGLDPRLIFPTTAGDLVFSSGADAVTLTVNAVPEPASLILLGTGLIAALRRRRRPSTW